MPVLICPNWNTDASARILVNIYWCVSKDPCEHILMRHQGSLWTYTDASPRILVNIYWCDTKDPCEHFWDCVQQSCRNSMERWNAKIVCTDLFANYYLFSLNLCLAPHLREKWRYIPLWPLFLKTYVFKISASFISLSPSKKIKLEIWKIVSKYD